MIQDAIISLVATGVGWLPMGYSFGAGMVAIFNPCGVAMLPAYLGLYLGHSEEDAKRPPSTVRAARALGLGLLVTVGFIILFSTIGAGFSLAGQFVVSTLPWAGLAIGLALVVAGAWTLLGRSLPLGPLERVTAWVRAPKGPGVTSFVLFGIAYGVASLSCTLPIFLAVVGSALARGGFWAALTQFVGYALGMGFILIVITLGLALAKGAALGLSRGILPHVQSVSAAFLLGAGVYIIYYWLVRGQLFQGLV